MARSFGVPAVPKQEFQIYPFLKHTFSCVARPHALETCVQGEIRRVRISLEGCFQECETGTLMEDHQQLPGTEKHIQQDENPVGQISL